MIIGFRGRLGKGKTLGMVVIGHWLQEITNIDYVGSNFYVDYADYIIENPNHMDQLTREKDLIALLDEVWAWWDSRKAMSNEDMSDIVMNSRKRGCVIVYTVQYLNMADVRLRQLTDYIVVPQHYEAAVINAEHDLLVLNVFETEDMEKVRTFKINPEPFYQAYDTSEEVSTVEKGEQYDKELEDIKEMFIDGKFEHKKEAISYLNVKEGFSPTMAERLVDVAYADIKEEVED